jgi:hypothetical protein
MVFYLSLFIPWTLACLSVLAIDMSLSRLSASSLRRVLAGKTPVKTRVGEMITSFCGLLEKNNPRFDLTRLDPRAGIVFLFLFDDICLRLATFGLV